MIAEISIGSRDARTSREPLEASAGTNEFANAPVAIFIVSSLIMQFGHRGIEVEQAAGGGRPQMNRLLIACRESDPKIPKPEVGNSPHIQEVEQATLHKHNQ